MEDFEEEQIENDTSAFRKKRVTVVEGQVIPLQPFALKVKRGRAIIEALSVTDEIRKLVIARAPAMEIANIAISQGMKAVASSDSASAAWKASRRARSPMAATYGWASAHGRTTSS